MKNFLRWFNKSRIILTIYFIASIGVVALGINYYTFQKRDLKAKINDELSSIAKLKVSEIQTWMNERIADANVFAQSSIMSMRFESLLKRNSNEDKQLLAERIEQVKFHYNYDCIIFLDINKRIILSTDKKTDNLSFETIQKIDEAKQSKHAVFSDIYFCHAHNKIHLDFIAPIAKYNDNNSKLLGYLILRVAPEAYLYPLINSWPTNSKTAETLLVQNRNDSALFINEVRHTKNTALKMKIPLNRIEVPAVQGLLGYRGFWEGVDYRGEKVISYLAQIPNTDWIMVSKVDKSEIYQPLRNQAWVTGIVLVLLLVVLGAVLITIRNADQKKYFQHLLEKEIERKALVSHFEYLIKYANDIIVLANSEGKIIEANNSALIAYQRSSDEMRKLYLKDIGDFNNMVENKTQTTINITSDKPYETIHKRRNAEIFNVEISEKIIEIDGIHYYQAIIRDITERIRAQQKLNEANQWFKTTLYSIGDGVITTDRNGLINQLNPVAESLTGWSELEAKGKKLDEVFKIVNEETHCKVEDPVKKVLKDGLIVGLANHTILISKDGRETPIADSGAPIKNDDGEIVGVVLVFRDQVEERAHQKAIEESEERFVHLFERAPLGYQSLDENGNFIEVNEAWLTTLGYDKQEVIGKWFGDFLTPEYVDAFKERFPMFKKIGKVHSEFEMIHKKGYKLFVAFDGRIGHKSDGSFEKTHCILQDITERKQTEEALRKSERKLREAQEMAHLGFWSLNIKTGDVEWSDEVYNIFHLNPREFTPQMDSILALSPWPEDHQRDKEIIKRATESSAPGSFEQKFLLPDKSVGHYYSTFQGVYDDKGELISIVGTVLDITERKQAELKLRESKEFIQTIIENLPIGLAVNTVEPAISFEFMNENFLKLYHTTREQLSIPDNFWNAVYEDPAFREEIKSRVISDVSTGKPEKMYWKDIPITKNNQVVSYITARNIPLPEKNLMISTVWDVTDRTLSEEQIQKLNNRLHYLVSALNQLTTAQTIEEIEQIVTSSARMLVGSDGCTFVLRDGDNCYYVDENSISPLWKGKKFPLSACISGWVMLNQKSVVIPDIYSDDRIPIDVYKPTFVKSLVMVPINPLKPMGAIGNYWSRNYTPTENEIKLIETLADATARVYENIKLYENLENKVKEKTKELNLRIEELERFHDATIDRELRMKELREEIKRLKGESQN